MPSIEFDDDRPPRSRDELLAMVRHDGLRRRYRRNGLVGGLALVLVAALAVPVLAGGDDGSERKVAAVDQPTTTVEETSTTTSTEVAVVETVPTTAGTAPPTTSRVAVPRTTTSLVCRNSYDERCGPFRWDPAPGPDDPGTVEITFTPAEPKVGEEVTFRIRKTDPDGPASTNHSTLRFGDGMSMTVVGDRLVPPEGCRRFYGPWTPPERRADSVSFSEPPYKYKAAGTYTVVFEAGRDDWQCTEPLNPYNSAATGSTEITISPAPA